MLALLGCSERASACSVSNVERVLAQGALRAYVEFLVAVIVGAYGAVRSLRAGKRSVAAVLAFLMAAHPGWWFPIDGGGDCGLSKDALSLLFTALIVIVAAAPVASGQRWNPLLAFAAVAGIAVEIRVGFESPLLYVPLLAPAWAVLTEWLLDKPITISLGNWRTAQAVERRAFLVVAPLGIVIAGVMVFESLLWIFRSGFSFSALREGIHQLEWGLPLVGRELARLFGA